MRRVAVVLLLAAAAAAVAAATAYAVVSPKAVRASIVDAAKAQHSVHYATKQVIGNSLTTLTGDVEAGEGIQHISVKLGQKTGRLTILVLDRVAYLRANAYGLQLQGLTNTQASKYAGEWISIPKGDKLYGPTAEDVTLGSVIQIIEPHGRLSVAFKKAHGRRVVAVGGVSGKGKKKQLHVLVAPARGKRLPLEEDEFVPGQEFVSHTALSKWNEPVEVHAPAGSTPISTVRQS
jgi:hypothetical protein